MSDTNSTQTAPTKSMENIQRFVNELMDWHVRTGTKYFDKIGDENYNHEERCQSLVMGAYNYLRYCIGICIRPDMQSEVAKSLLQQLVDEPPEVTEVQISEAQGFRSMIENAEPCDALNNIFGLNRKLNS